MVSPLPDGWASDRGSVKAIHAHLRSLIMTDELAMGEEINQAQVAKALGVSRAPIREALRMLQEEGLVVAQKNYRSRVAMITPAEIEAVYVQRMQLEVLGVRITVPHIPQTKLARISQSLDRVDGTPVNVSGYAQSHKRFHQMLLAGLSEDLQTQTSRLFDATERYRRIYANRSANAAENARRDHHAILDAALKRNGDDAGTFLARHYHRTALELLKVVSPRYRARALDGAARMLGI